ncbi:MAG TPA: hypothetical protein VHU23_10705 [Rhizomicrobium sp.]|nr:hypothetical protein [Rhizomicrobium sp.]
MKMRRALIASIIPALMLAACAGGDPALRKNPSFQAGYEDGCEAATDQGADLRDRTIGDKQLLKSDKAYKAGYNNGLQMCRRTNNGIGTMPGVNPPLVPGPGGH